MNVVRVLRDSLKIDYGNLGDQDKIYVRDSFTEECVSRLNWVTAVVFFGEIILTALDMLNGFFKDNPLNYMNFVAEILIITSSLLVNWRCSKLMKLPFEQMQEKIRLLAIYKVILLVSIMIFAFTDIYVRQNPLGAYIIFLFILLILPFYKAEANFSIYLALIVLVAVGYLVCVPDALANALFSVISIFIAFLLATECLRAFFIKKIVSTHISGLMSQRFESLATQTIMALSNAVEVKDIYDAMTSNRSYRSVMPQATVRQEIEKNAGKQFARELAKIMLEIIDEDTEYILHA